MINFNQLIRHSGSEPLFHAIEMSIIALYNDQPIHIHTEGLRGTGKTTYLSLPGEP
jgi:magnesium chelatase subunit I